MSDPIDIVERLAGMSADHGPDGWPAVRMRDITALCDEITRLRAEAVNLRTVMVAAAEEIAAHWDAHCDAEGYGPTNLQRRLEDGIPSLYGYTAGAFAELKAENERLRALSAQPAAVPGWQWVPVEQTPEMKDACLKATKGWWDSRAWPAMLAAAPQAPQQDEAGHNASLSGGRRPSA